MSTLAPAKIGTKLTDSVDLRPRAPYHLAPARVGPAHHRGLGDLGVIRAFAEKYRLHPLAVEDVLHIPQRPKVQAYEENPPYQARLFIIVRELELHFRDILLSRLAPPKSPLLAAWPAGWSSWPPDWSFVATR